MQVEFEKNDIKHTFNLRDISKEKHFIEFNQAPILKYLDLTTDATKTSTTDIAFDQNGIPHYIKSIYQKISNNNTYDSGHLGWVTDRVIGGTYTINSDGYDNYCIAINSTKYIRHTYDRNNSSTNDNIQSDGTYKTTSNYSFTDSADSVRPYPSINEPSNIDNSSIEQLRKAEIVIEGKLSDLDAKEKIIWNGFDMNTWIARTRIFLYAKIENNVLSVRIAIQNSVGTGNTWDRRGTNMRVRHKCVIATYD